MVAPIDEVADEEMEVDDDGEGAGDARAEPRADEPGDDTSRDWSSGTCEWNSAGAVAGVLPGCARTHESESHSTHTVVSMDVAAVSVDGGALPVPIRERKRLPMREQEVVGTSQRWYHLERRSWRISLMLTK